MDELEIVICFLYCMGLHGMCICTTKLCFLRIYHDSEVVGGWKVYQLSSNRRKEGIIIRRSTRPKAQLI